MADEPRMIPCRRCAGSGEYPPDGSGDECSWCDGYGEVPAPSVNLAEGDPVTLEGGTPDAASGRSGCV